MSNPVMVHKAFLVVLDELKSRYGTDLLAGFQGVVEENRNLANGNSPQKTAANTSPNKSKTATKQGGRRPKHNSHEEKKDDSIKIQDMFQQNCPKVPNRSRDKIICWMKIVSPNLN